MTIDLTQIATALIALIVALISKYVIPWIKSKTDVENGKATEAQSRLIQLAIDTAVGAAEQTYNSDQGQQKKSYVLGLLRGQGFDVDTAAFDAAVENAVLILHNQLKANE